MRALACVLWVIAPALAQSPSGIITGMVNDSSGAVMVGTSIIVTNRGSGTARSTRTGPEGIFTVPALLAGEYEVRAEAAGFQAVERGATVEPGTTTTVNITMQIGTASDVIRVDAAAPQIKYDSHKIDGVVSRQEVEDLPLNGRNFAELAKLEPGVTVANNASRVDVTVLGAGKPVVTVDGGAVNNYQDGLSHNKMSAEIVEEFQISTVNFDLSNQSGSGTVNIVTRSGGNDFHGGAFFFFRDHNIAAYPALQRDPNNSDPFFRREHAGGTFGGPLRRNRIFFFGTFEQSHQDGVVSVQPRVPEFAALGGIFPNPIRAHQYSIRSDIRASSNHNIFLRFSHDFILQYGIIATANLPSTWTRFDVPEEQGIIGVTSALGASLVNELRLSYSYWGQSQHEVTRAECPGTCFGFNTPFTTVSAAGFSFGTSHGTPLTQLQRRYEISDAPTWQKGGHRTRFGFGWEGFFPATSNPIIEPASITLYSPSAARAAGLPVPAVFNTPADVMQLPLLSFQTAEGDPKVPIAFNIDNAKRWSVVRFWWQDSWRIKPRLTVNYGLGWSYDTFPLNNDLSKPDFLKPILGSGGLVPSRKDPNNFAPAAGFAWGVTRDDKTVVRGGAGIYYDQYLWIASQERTSLAPRGEGRNVLNGSYVGNPIAGINGVPVGRALDFPNNPTAFTGAQLLSILPSVRNDLQQLLGSPTNTDLSVRNIDVFKQQTTAGGLFTHDFTSSYSEHFNLGIQRELKPSLVLSGDFVFRQFMHTDMAGVDYNLWNRVGGPVIPICSASQQSDPKAVCSTGPILVDSSGGRSHYKGLLVRLDKRMSKHFQFLVTYALSSNVGWTGTGNGFNQTNWFEDFGPLSTDSRHVLNGFGIINLPKGFRISLVASYITAKPYSAFLTNLDLNGDGLNGDLLPGTKVGQLNRSLGKDDLVRLVDQFNSSFAGRRTPQNQLIPKITLPANFGFDDSYKSQDLRVSKTIRLVEHLRATVFGEIFNALNTANLTGYSGNLQQPASFGQPTNRAIQIFGSGGPRAFQFGTRLAF